MGKYLIVDLVHEPNKWFHFVLGEGEHLSQFRKHQSLQVYIMLCCEADGESVATISHKQLATQCDLSAGTVAQALEHLEQLGRIKILEWEHSRADLSDGLRWQVFKRDGYKCTYCGKDDGPFEVDHVIPVSKGGRNTIDNLITACPRCNRHKSNKLGDTDEQSADH